MNLKKIIFVVIIWLILNYTAVADEYTYMQGNDFFNANTEKIINGNLSLNPIEVIQNLTNELFIELRKSRAEIISILIIAALSGTLRILKSEEGNDVCDIASFSCFIIMTIAAMRIFSITIGYGTEIIKDINNFITKLSPIFAALLVSGGSINSATAFHPLLSGAVYIMSLLTNKCILPLVYLSAILGIVGNITPRLQISALTKLIRSFGKWILMATLTVFSGITAIYGFSSPVLDAVALKSVKFAVGSFVPVVGGLLTDTVETVLSGTKLMKNAVGTAGMISIATICIVPILKMAAIKLMLDICAAIAEPLADKPITEMLKDISASIALVIGMVITMSVLFIIQIGIIMGATG